MERALILVTNDDGIDAKGLWATVEALLPIGEVLVVAPDRQWSGGSRSLSRHTTGRLTLEIRQIAGQAVTAYAVDATPAQTIIHAILELVPRRPELVVSGINFGSNLGMEVTMSGTVGAALEAGVFGIPAMAVSLEIDPDYFLTGDDTTDFAATMAITQRLARRLLVNITPHDLDVLNINVPNDANISTPWRLTRLSRQRCYIPLAPDRANNKGRLNFRVIENAREVEPESDIWAVKVDRVISVTPLSLDLTSRVDFAATDVHLRAEPEMDADRP